MATRTKSTATPAPTGFVDPRVARFREVSGHNGPWSSAEYEAAVGTIQPTHDPEPAPPAKVTELAEARDLAMAAFERINAAWKDAIRTEHHSHDRGEIRISKLGEMLSDPSAPARRRKAEKAVKDLTEQRDLADAELTRALVKWRAADTAWRAQMRRDDLAAQHK